MSKLGGRCYGCGGGGSAAEETPNTAGPSSTITVSTFGPLGRMISAEARVSVAPGNALTARADGLYVPANSDTPVVPVNETPNTGGQTTTIVVSATGNLGRSITAALRVSEDSGNQLQTRQNGLYVPAASAPPAAVTCQTVKALFASGTPVQVLGEDSAGNCVKGAISVSVTPERMREIFSAPITVAEVFGVNAAGQLGKGVIAVSGAETANSAQQTPTATVSVSGALGRTIGVNVRVSSASNNQLQSLADGLFVPPPSPTGGTTTVECNSVRALYADGYVDRIQGVGNSSTCVSEPAAMLLQRLLVGSTFSFTNITTAGEISGLQVRIQVPGAATPVNLPGFVIPLEAVRDCNNALLGHFVRT